MTRIAIIGAGLSGLATGDALHRKIDETSMDPKPSITLFESSDLIGGVIQTESCDGFLIDHGADMFATNPSSAIKLCEQLGIEDRLLLPQSSRQGARIYSGGKLVPIPEGFVLMRATKTWPMLTTPLLSWSAKLRFLVERFCQRGPHDEDFDESVADFVSRRMGRSVLEKIVAPLAAGIYTADVNRLSMRSTMNAIHQMEKEHGSLNAATKFRARAGEDGVERTSTGARYSQFRAFPGGMSQLICSLAGGLPDDSIQLRCAVTRIHRVADQWRLGSGDEELGSFDRVVLAVPAKPTARLLRPLDAQAADAFASIRSASTAIVVLGIKKSQIEKCIETFGFVVPPSLGKNILAASFASHKFAGRAPEGSVLIRCFLGGMLHPDAIHQTDQELIRCVLDELGEMIGLHGHPQVVRVVRWPDSMPQYEVGHHRKVDAIELAMKKLPNLFVNNNALHGVGIAPLIGQSQRTAQAVLESLGH